MTTIAAAGAIFFCVLAVTALLLIVAASQLVGSAKLNPLPPEEVSVWIDRDDDGKWGAWLLQVEDSFGSQIESGHDTAEAAAEAVREWAKDLEGGAAVVVSGRHQIGIVT